MLTHLILCLAAAQSSGTSTDDFDSGQNPNGWSFASFDVLEANGGNPGGWLHVAGLDTFYPMLESGTSASWPWIGDLAATGAVRISLDAITLHTDFPIAGGFFMSVLLRDTQGTFNVDDDDYAYFVGEEVPQPGAGWKHFDFDVPSRCGVNVPPGWHGGWSGDGDDFRPGVTWSDLISQVDRVEIWWSDPTNFAIFQMWEAGVDNLEIEYMPALTLNAPTPGQAGAFNLFSAEHAAPGQIIGFAGALNAGAATLQCNGRPLSIGLLAPTPLGRAQADAAGVASLSFRVPPSLAGATVQLQAVNARRCEASAVLPFTFL
jgi:hypothetical protein